ncbi:MAG: hypothetical protein ACI8V2_002929, partial [Candidatus Latescibacterota bacterium]
MKKPKKLRVAMVHAEVLPIPTVLGGAIGQTIYETAFGMPDIDWTVISRWDDALQDVETDARFQYVDIAARRAAVWRTFGGKKREIHSEFELRRFCYVDGVADLLTTPDVDVDVDVVQVHNRPQF